MIMCCQLSIGRVFVCFHMPIPTTISPREHQIVCSFKKLFRGHYIKQSQLTGEKGLLEYTFPDEKSSSDTWLKRRVCVQKSKRKKNEPASDLAR